MYVIHWLKIPPEGHIGNPVAAEEILWSQITHAGRRRNQIAIVRRRN